jgi:hypothetical protein
MGEGDPRRVGARFTRSVLAVLGIRVAVAASVHCPGIAKRVLSSQKTLRAPFRRSGLEALSGLYRRLSRAVGLVIPRRS